MLEKIISGGQTGVDRAALDAALEKGFPCGGWCPAGRRAEDGPLPPRYPLKETERGDYEARTEENVLLSDGTLILSCGNPTGGTMLTISLAEKHKKPYLALDLNKTSRFETGKIRRWVNDNRIKVLNVAGPRASKSPEAYEKSKRIMEDLLQGKNPEPCFDP